MNYFELFGLPMAPSVDKSFLARKFFELQKKYHPDFFTQDSDAEQEHALDHSAAINKAFHIFQNEERTIEYFLQMRGLIEADEKFSLPPEFLMEMMEINEALTEEGEISVTNRVRDQELALFDEISPVIKSYDESRTTQADLLRLKEYYYKKKYLKRILDRFVD